QPIWLLKKRHWRSKRKSKKFANRFRMSSEIDESSLQNRQDTETNEGRGILFVVSAPSGGGKGTLIQRVLKQVPNLSYSVSFTTRAPRNGEVDGREYFFVTPEKFQQTVHAGECLASAHAHSHRD